MFPMILEYFRSRGLAISSFKAVFAVLVVSSEVMGELLSPTLQSFFEFFFFFFTCDVSYPLPDLLMSHFVRAKLYHSP